MAPEKRQPGRDDKSWCCAGNGCLEECHAKIEGHPVILQIMPFVMRRVPQWVTPVNLPFHMARQLEQQSCADTRDPIQLPGFPFVLDVLEVPATAGVNERSSVNGTIAALALPKRD